MSDLHVDLARQAMEESGEMQFIRDHIAAAQGNEVSAPAQEAPEADTVEVPVVEEEPESSEDEPVQQDAEQVDDAELTPEEEETLYLELDEDTQALIDNKYGGDINKALVALREGQSVIGRQGSELGELRKELQEFREQVSLGLQQAQPYPEWPDEYEEGPDAALKLRQIAEEAFQRQDVRTFQNALIAWEDADPVSAGLYRDLKEMQIVQAQALQAPVRDDVATLDAGVAQIRTDFPQFSDPAFQQAVAEELDKTPSLKAVLWEGVPGVSVEERLTVLREAAQRVASRTTSETAQQARKRVAIRASEEARAARVAAQSVRGGTARDTGPEPEKRTIPMGESGRSLDIDRLNAMLSPEDRI
jgi:hypothetical protein